MPMNYQQLRKLITCSAYITSIILVILYASYCLKTGRQGVRFIMHGSILLIVFPLIRISVMMALNYVAKRKGDEKPFTKDDIF